MLAFAPIGKQLSGVRIASSAVVFSEDKAWCYVAIAAGMFQRLPIDLNSPLTGGYFVARGISAGQPVVISGTGLLLSREVGAPAAGYD